MVDNTELNRFEALFATGEVVGFAQYQKTPELIVFTHTEVFDRYEGKGFGSALAKGSLDHVRETDLKVLPLCPFIKAYIARHPAYADLVYDKPHQHAGQPDAEAG